jgi:demethylmenaquinone methyltransferase/2-methoxy-6-polyprenyl-1,4-benzoquinol methylase
MTVTRLHHVQISIPVGAEDAARAFYCGVLGLPEIEKPDSLKGRGGLWLQLGDLQLHIGVEDGVDRAATRAHLAYEVADAAAWRERLLGHGISLLDSVAIPGYDRFEGRDPFGNRIEFIQPLRAPDLLREQIAYYRARAAEYDEWFYRVGRYDYGDALNRRWFDEVHEVMQALHSVGPVGDVLELACGTGIWTEQLLSISQRITAIDASPEMLALNRERLKAPNVVYHERDLFAWEPQTQYDMVFFGFWLSHVPPEYLDAFLDKAARALKPGGRLFLVDSRPAPTSSAHDHTLPDAQGFTHARKLNDGRQFSIVKVFYDPDALRARLLHAGLDAPPQTTETYFLYASGTRAFLAEPSLTYKDSYLEAMREFQGETRYLDHDPDWLADDANFAALTQRLISYRTSPPPGGVSASELWLVSGGVFIGRASIRHQLNDSLRRYGGHIGYEIRPSRRRQGYGTLICRLALEHARSLGIQRALITCDETNTASRRIIEANGGRFEQAVQVEGRPVRTLHFWVELT